MRRYINLITNKGDFYQFTTETNGIKLVVIQYLLMITLVAISFSFQLTRIQIADVVFGILDGIVFVCYLFLICYSLTHLFKISKSTITMKQSIRMNIPSNQITIIALTISVIFQILLRLPGVLGGLASLFYGIKTTLFWIAIFIPAVMSIWNWLQLKSSFKTTEYDLLRAIITTAIFTFLTYVAFLGFALLYAFYGF